jgi:hypothetical protein
VGVEKVRSTEGLLGFECLCRVFLLSVRLSGGWPNRCGRWAEKPRQSLDVLSRRCQEELLSHELQSVQAQATQSNLILKFREQGFTFFLCR